MISDSPYEFREPVLGPTEGAIAGLLGAAAMLGLLEVLRKVSGYPTVTLLRHLAFIALPGCRQGCTEPFPLAVGLAVLGFLGAMGGVLYAVSQQRVPTPGLVTVGIFYGVFLWVVGGLLAGPIGGAELRRLIRSWPWLSASLCYGIWLSVVAAWADKRHPLPAQPVSPD